jgi:hypothetical protein
MWRSRRPDPAQYPVSAHDIHNRRQPKPAHQPITATKESRYIGRSRDARYGVRETETESISLNAGNVYHARRIVVRIHTYRPDLEEEEREA